MPETSTLLTAMRGDTITSHDPAIERIDEVQGLPVIGRRYKVQCVPGLVGYFPVVGILHRDPELNPFTPAHYHYDWRFFRDCDIRSLLNLPPDLQLDPRDYMTWANNPGWRCMDWHLSIQVRTLHRQMPTFPFLSHIAEKVEPLMEGKRLAPGCMTCPHRGISLAGLPVDPDGCVTCPGHGLRWNLTTGEIVRRSTKGNPQ